MGGRSGGGRREDRSYEQTGNARETTVLFLSCSALLCFTCVQAAGMRQTAGMSGRESDGHIVYLGPDFEQSRS